MYHSPRKAFTLIELLVVIAIIAILAVVVVLTLNPAQLLAQSRDANRVSDIATLSSAFNLYVTDQGGVSSFSLGNASNTSISVYDPSASSTCGTLGLPAFSSGSWLCSTSSTYRNISSTGWIPVNLNNISAGSPISSLPIDPTNQTSSGLFYAYNTNGSQFEVTANLESTKYKAQYGNTPQTNLFPEVISGGSQNISALYNPAGLVGYWSLNEGSGTTAFDTSGNGNNGAWNGSTTNGSYYSGGKVGNYAGNFNGVNNYINPNISLTTGAYTASMWVSQATSSSATDIMIIENTSTGEVANIFIDNPSIALAVFGGGQYATMTTPALNSWNLVTYTYDGVAVKGYLNGVLQNSSTISLTITTGNEVYIGSGSGNRYFPGYIQDFRIYNRAISAAEIKALYTAEH